ncbi:MAG: DUF4149 domain-containing protein [Deltaproteobacteria bacterium]|nr:MAG: DUF4149 domain-containing protein [Deltaproteobacteria bacterium]
MNLLILSLSHFLHLLATVVWIGGIFMVLLVILPGARTSLESPPLTGKLMKEITRRLTPMVNASIVVLIITGPILGHYGKDMANPLEFYNHWTPVMGVKHLLVLVMVVIHFYRGWLLAPKIGRLAAQAEGTPALSSRVAGLQKLSLNLVKVNLVLGLAVLLVTGVIMSQ